MVAGQGPVQLVQLRLFWLAQALLEDDVEINVTR
jgi:hypothetical protein